MVIKKKKILLYSFIVGLAFVAHKSWTMNYQPKPYDRRAAMEGLNNFHRRVDDIRTAQAEDLHNTVEYLNKRLQGGQNHPLFSVEELMGEPNPNDNRDEVLKRSNGQSEPHDTSPILTEENAPNNFKTTRKKPSLVTTIPTKYLIGGGAGAAVLIIVAAYGTYRFSEYIRAKRKIKRT